MSESLSESSRTGTLPPALRSFELSTILFFAFSLGFHTLERWRGVGSFQGSPLSSPQERFGDFTIFVNKYKYFHTSSFFTTWFPINYPAPAAIFYEIFFRLPGNYPLIGFLSFCILSFILSAILLARALTNRGIGQLRATLFVATLLAFSWPVILLVDRANVEVLVFVTIAIAMWAYATGRAWMAAAFFGIGASLKLFPFVLFGLFVSRREWRKVAFGALTFFLVSVISLAILGPSIPVAFHGLAFGMKCFQKNYMGIWQQNENGVDHSLFALYKTLLVVAFHHGYGFERSLTIYLPLTAIGGTLLYLLRIRFLPLLNQVLVLTIASVYFTAFSGDGTLIHLYAPLVMLFFLAIEAHRDGSGVPGLSLMLNCLVFILSVNTFLIYRGYRFIGPAKGIALGILLWAALRYPLGPGPEESYSETILFRPDLSWLKERRSA